MKPDEPATNKSLLIMTAINLTAIFTLGFVVTDDILFTVYYGIAAAICFSLVLALAFDGFNRTAWETVLGKIA